MKKSVVLATLVAAFLSLNSFAQTTGQQVGKKNQKVEHKAKSIEQKSTKPIAAKTDKEVKKEVKTSHSAVKKANKKTK